MMRLYIQSWAHMKQDRKLFIVGPNYNHFLWAGYFAEDLIFSGMYPLLYQGMHKVELFCIHKQGLVRCCHSHLNCRFHKYTWLRKSNAFRHRIQRLGWVFEQYVRYINIHMAFFSCVLLKLYEQFRYVTEGMNIDNQTTEWKQISNQTKWNIAIKHDLRFMEQILMDVTGW